MINRKLLFVCVVAGAVIAPRAECTPDTLHSDGDLQNMGKTQLENEINDLQKQIDAINLKKKEVQDDKAANQLSLNNRMKELEDQHKALVEEGDKIQPLENCLEEDSEKSPFKQLSSEETARLEEITNLLESLKEEKIEIQEKLCKLDGTAFEEEQEVSNGLLQLEQRLIQLQENLEGMNSEENDSNNQNNGQSGILATLGNFFSQITGRSNEKDVEKGTLNEQMLEMKKKFGGDDNPSNQLQDELDEYSDDIQQAAASRSESKKGNKVTVKKATIIGVLATLVVFCGLTIAKKYPDWTSIEERGVEIESGAQGGEISEIGMDWSQYFNTSISQDPSKPCRFPSSDDIHNGGNTSDTKAAADGSSMLFPVCGSTIEKTVTVAPTEEGNGANNSTESISNSGESAARNGTANAGNSSEIIQTTELSTTKLSTTKATTTKVPTTTKKATTKKPYEKKYNCNQMFPPWLVLDEQVQRWVQKTKTAVDEVDCNNNCEECYDYYNQLESFRQADVYRDPREDRHQFQGPALGQILKKLQRASCDKKPTPCITSKQPRIWRRRDDDQIQCNVPPMGWNPQSRKYFREEVEHWTRTLEYYGDCAKKRWLYMALRLWIKWNPDGETGFLPVRYWAEREEWKMIGKHRNCGTKRRACKELSFYKQYVPGKMW